MHSIISLAAISAMGSFMLVSGFTAGRSSKIHTPFLLRQRRSPPPHLCSILVLYPLHSQTSPPPLEIPLSATTALTEYAYKSAKPTKDIVHNYGSGSALFTSVTDDGVSIMIGPTSVEHILQLKYTKQAGTVYFELDQLNKNPFKAIGYSLSDSVVLNAYCAPSREDFPFVSGSGTGRMAYSIRNTASIALSLCRDSR